MNEILLKRIVKSAENHEQRYNVGEEHGYLYTHKGDIKEAVIYGAIFALQNQWISVDEVLPEFQQDVVVTNSEGDYWTAWRSNENCEHKDNNGFVNYGIGEITHWMPIPRLEGGEG